MTPPVVDAAGFHMVARGGLYRVRRIVVAIIDPTQSVPSAIASARSIPELMSFTFL
jgi:hypothetical protein